jgi:hypothetical protein
MSLPSPFDPQQNANYGPRPKFDTAEDVLNDIRAVFRRYVDMRNEQNAIVSLWAVHTHLIPILQFTPYLSITSAERESGKSRVLDLLAYLVPKPWKTERTSAAALVRKTANERPTLLLDEADTAFSGDKDYSEVLRGILNSGFNWKGNTTICVGQGAKMSYESFSTFGAKAIAGINRLPDTVGSRSIPIRLKRAPRGKVQKFEERLPEVIAPLEELRVRIEQLVDRIAEQVRCMKPAMPQELSDRQADVTFPLLAIADIAGGEWPGLARQALVTLCTSGAESQSKGEQLLAGIKKVFDEKSVDRIASVDLAADLGKMEDSPWAEWGKSEKPITAAKLAGQLRHYDIHPHAVRIGSMVFKGYEISDFEDAWTRYLPPPPVEPLSDGYIVTTRINIGDSADATEVTGRVCNRSETSEMASKNAPCNRVTAPKPGEEVRATEEGL